MYLVSACLCGVNCKYSGGNNYNEECLELVKGGKAILICPEQLGGLTTPRCPAEIVGTIDESGKAKVLTKEGNDVSENFFRGAEEVIKLVKSLNIKKAVLKESSPSCGVNYIYDGTFTGNKIQGQGITTSLLKKYGVQVISDEDFCKRKFD